jgi:hypothetical protein
MPIFRLQRGHCLEVVEVVNPLDGVRVMHARIKPFGGDYTIGGVVGETDALTYRLLTYMHDALVKHANPNTWDYLLESFTCDLGGDFCVVSNVEEPNTQESLLFVGLDDSIHLFRVIGSANRGSGGGLQYFFRGMPETEQVFHERAGNPFEIDSHGFVELANRTPETAGITGCVLKHGGSIRNDQAWQGSCVSRMQTVVGFKIYATEPSDRAFRCCDIPANIAGY